MIYIQGTSLVSKGRDKEITTAIRRLGILREADIRLSISFSREKKKVSKFPGSEHMRQERVNRETYERTNRAYDNDESAVLARDRGGRGG